MTLGRKSWPSSSSPSGNPPRSSSGSRSVNAALGKSIDPSDVAAQQASDSRVLIVVFRRHLRRHVPHHPGRLAGLLLGIRCISDALRTDISTFPGRTSDANAHMANTAYINVCIDVRMIVLRLAGIRGDRVRAPSASGRWCDATKWTTSASCTSLDPIRVTFLLAGLSDDASRFKLRNEIYREDGQMAARITSLGGWFDSTRGSSWCAGGARECAARARQGPRISRS
jgi:hypothetical protein